MIYMKGEVNLTMTSSETDILVVVKLKNTKADHITLDIEHSEENPYSLPCLQDIVCQLCSEMDDKVDDCTAGLVNQPLTKRNVTQFGSLLQYQCRSAMEFFISQEGENITTIPNVNLTCQWNETWNQELPECTCKLKLILGIDHFMKLIHLGVACVDPPSPPWETKLERHYEDGGVIEFGQNVTYTCKTGLFFEEDYHLPHFNLTCLPDGNFTNHLPWKYCLNPKGKYFSSSLTFMD